MQEGENAIPSPPPEAPAEAPRKRLKFLELMPKRKRKLLDSIRLLSNLSNRSNYQWSKSDTAELLDDIEQARADLARLRDAFKYDNL